MPRVPNARDRFTQYSHPYELSEPVSHYDNPTSKTSTQPFSTLTGAVDPRYIGRSSTSGGSQTQSYHQAQPVPDTCDPFNCPRSVSQPITSSRSGSSKLPSATKRGSMGHSRKTSDTSSSPKKTGKPCTTSTALTNLHGVCGDNMGKMTIDPNVKSAFPAPHYLIQEPVVYVPSGTMMTHHGWVIPVQSD